MKRMIFDEEHEIFRVAARRFFQSEIGPHSERWRAQGYVDREAYLRLGAQGYLLVAVPEQYGGAGIADCRYEQILHEENVRYGDIGLYANLHSMIVAPYIAKLGTDEQCRRFLPPAARGEKILAIAMTEPAAGSDLAGIKTRAEDQGDYWLLNGSKTYISNGAQADLVVVAARSAAHSRHSIGLFVVERGMAGFERGRRLEKMGLDSQDTSELFFENVRLPKANQLGDATKGFAYMAAFLATERLQVAIGSIAHAQAAFDVTLDFVKSRRAFGQTIGSFQNSRFKLAELRTQLDGIQSFVDQCVMLANAGELDAATAAEAKLAATELEGRVLDECVQLHGGAGYMEEVRISRMYRDARATRIYAGASEIMKEIIARGLGLDDRASKAARDRN
jgi:alkylation response protein AidB-like acyl-CoA dehydrogenase